MNRTIINRLQRIEGRLNSGVVILDLTSDGEHTGADVDKAMQGRGKVVVLIDDEAGED